MKKIYVLLFVTAGIILSANAQPFEKGNKLLGGSVGFSNQNLSENSPSTPKKITAFNVAPSIGFFTKPNRLTGFSLLFATQTSKYNNTKQSANGFGAGVYKQYWNNLGKNFYFIVEGNLSGSYSKRKTEDAFNAVSGNPITQQKSLSFTAGVLPGIAYRVSNRFVIDLFFVNFLSVNDTYSKVKDNFPGNAPREYDSNTIALTAGFTKFSSDNLQFGFRYILK